MKQKTLETTFTVSTEARIENNLLESVHYLYPTAFLGVELKFIQGSNFTFKFQNINFAWTLLR